MAGSPLPHRKKIEEETRLVLEAFLQGALSHGKSGAPGHVGRAYHDPQSYMHRNPNEHAQHCPSWTPVHEEINRVEEKKHGFRTSIKQLLRRRTGSRDPAESPPFSKNSLKRPKGGGEAGEDTRQKRTFSFKNLLWKKGTDSGEITDDPVASPQRPDSLPLDTCYCQNQPLEQQGVEGTDVDGAEFYTLVAQKLDHLVKQQQLVSPVAAKSLPFSTEQNNTLPADAVCSTSVNSGELPRELDEKQKEQILQKLIALLEEQAGVFNKEIEADPFLRNALSRLSYRSFSRLAEAFTSRTPPSVPSPQLAKLALTMELTRKVAGINSHTVHTLMGYSLQYMDMFVPWLQQQGGWESIVAQEEIFDLQLD